MRARGTALQDGGGFPGNAAGSKRCGDADAERDVGPKATQAHSSLGCASGCGRSGPLVRGLADGPRLPRPAADGPSTAPLPAAILVSKSAAAGCTMPRSSLLLDQGSSREKLRKSVRSALDQANRDPWFECLKSNRISDLWRVSE